MSPEFGTSLLFLWRSVLMPIVENGAVGGLVSPELGAPLCLFGVLF